MVVEEVEKVLCQLEEVAEVEKIKFISLILQSLQINRTYFLDKEIIILQMMSWQLRLFNIIKMHLVYQDSVPIHFQCS